MSLITGFEREPFVPRPLEMPAGHSPTSAGRNPTRRTPLYSRATPAHVRLLLVAACCVAAFVYLASPGPARADGRANQKTGAADDAPRPLAFDEVVRVQLAGGGLHRYLLRVPAGQFLRLKVMQQGVDVALKLAGPGGKTVAEADSPVGLYGLESLSLLAPEDGDYLLTVKASSPRVPRPYELSAEGPRQPAPEDLKRLQAEQVFMEGQNLRWKGERRQALEKYGEALRLWRELDDPLGQTYTLTGRGMAYKALGEFKEAVADYELALKLLTEPGRLLHRSFVLNEMGAAYRDLDNAKRALPLYAEALDIRARAGDERGQAQIYNNIGLAYQRTGDHPGAIPFYEKALPLWDSAGEEDLKALTQNNLAGVYREVGRPHEAVAIYESLLAPLKAAGNNVGLVPVLNNIALNYDDWGETERALSYCAEALALARKHNNEEGEATAIANAGWVYLRLGDTARALGNFEQSLAIREKLKAPGPLAEALGNVGDALAHQGDYRRALEYYGKARPLLSGVNDRQKLAYILTSTGAAYAFLGEPAKALDYFAQALAIREGLKDIRGQALTLEKAGQSHLLARDAARALASFERSLPLWRKVGDRHGESLTLNGMALAERERGRHAEALRLAESAIDIVESLRTKVGSRQLRLTYLAARHDYYDLYIELCMVMHRQQPAAGHDAAAFLASEKARARSLLDALTEARVQPGQDADPALVERERALQHELNKRADLLIALRNKQSGEARVKELERELDDLIRRLDDVRAQIRTRSPRYAALTQPSVAGLREVQQALDDDTVLLEYSLADRRGYVWAVWRGGHVSAELPPRMEIESAALTLNRLLSARQQVPGETPAQYVKRVREAEEQYGHRAAELSRTLLGPVAGHIEGKRLLIVAEGALQYVPFAALTRPSAAGKLSAAAEPAGAPDGAAPAPYLAAGHEIVYLPSASMLLLREGARRERATRAVAVLADPVFSAEDSRLLSAVRGPRSEPPAGEMAQAPQGAVREAGANISFPRLRSTRDEARGIIEAVPAGSSMEAVDFSASKAMATSAEMGQYRVLHFATHGIADDLRPELSGVVLSLVDEKGRPLDGFLRLHEVYNLRLSADLVVLSACRTALGVDVRGEGLVGLTRGFMHAGAAGVVASLWKVDDEATAELMRRFYHSMFREGMSPPAALRAAQLTMSRRGRWRSPFYWAAFVPQGSWPRR